MDYGERSFLAVKLWLVLVPVIITVISHSKLVAACNEVFEADTLGFISIDCGASVDYMDVETSLLYVSDTCMDTGEIHEISPDVTSTNLYQQQRKNLRSFPQGTRSCYVLKLKQGGNNKYLIRAIFEYGNYDNKNQIPVFDLYIGVNRWATINETINPIYEIIHVPSEQYLDVCLVNIKRGVPYISVLELRTLDNSIYRNQNGALSNIRRYDVGSDKDYIRYPTDSYDRLWNPLNFNDWKVTSTESTIYTQSNDEGYKLPAEVLQTAAVAENASIPLSLYFTPPNPASRCYVYFYFAEIEKLEDGKQRELRIDLNGERYLTESVKLDYLTATVRAQNDPPIYGEQLYFSIYLVNDIPPILNAVEVYVLLELPFSPTNLDDVNAIKDIKRRYRVTRDWQGDPCVPSSLSWDGLQCGNDTIPRITSLNLSSSKLTGEIETSLSNLQAITLLDLSYNSLKGPIPQFLAQLPNLKTLT